MVRETRFVKTASFRNERGSNTMRIFSVLVAALAIGICASPASAITGTKIVAFSGHYTGTASLIIDNGSVKISSISGNGTGTPSIMGGAHSRRRIR